MNKLIYAQCTRIHTYVFLCMNPSTPSKFNGIYTPAHARAYPASHSVIYLPNITLFQANIYKQMRTCTNASIHEDIHACMPTITYGLNIHTNEAIATSSCMHICAFNRADMYTNMRSHPHAQRITHIDTCMHTYIFIKLDTKIGKADTHRCSLMHKSIYVHVYLHNVYLHAHTPTQKHICKHKFYKLVCIFSCPHTFAFLHIHACIYMYAQTCINATPDHFHAMRTYKHTHTYGA